VIHKDNWGSVAHGPLARRQPGDHTRQIRDRLSPSLARSWLVEPTAGLAPASHYFSPVKPTVHAEDRLEGQTSLNMLLIQYFHPRKINLSIYFSFLGFDMIFDGKKTRIKEESDDADEWKLSSDFRRWSFWEECVIKVTFLFFPHFPDEMFTSNVWRKTRSVILWFKW